MAECKSCGCLLTEDTEFLIDGSAYCDEQCFRRYMARIQEPHIPG